MNVFQIVAISALALLVLVALTLPRRGYLSMRSAFLWAALFVVAAVLIAQPRLTVAIARFLGIGRGADLVFYVAILAGIAGFFATHARMRRIESEITTLTREIALRDAGRNDAASD